MILYGIQIMEGRGDREYTIAKLVGLPPVKPFENDKIKISGVGFSPKSDSSGRPQFPNIEPQYAKDIVFANAFVPNADYDVVVGLNDELESVVTKITPTDPKIRQEFEQKMKHVV